jgi:hypothetical protein
MRKILVIGTVSGALLAACAGCTTPVATQTAAIPGSPGPLNDPIVCRTIVGQADIDGTPQRIVGNACRQPDGSWQIDTDQAVLYPAYPYPDAWYYDPWLVWPTAVFGVGGSFVFFDHFHHFHHHPGHGGPWHGRGGGTMHAGGESMHGGGGMFMSAGGGMRR